MSRSVNEARATRGMIDRAKASEKNLKKDIEETKKRNREQAHKKEKFVPAWER